MKILSLLLGLSWFFRGTIGANIAAFLTVAGRLPMRLFKRTPQPVDEFIRIRKSIIYQGEVRTKSNMAV